MTSPILDALGSKPARRIQCRDARSFVAVLARQCVAGWRGGDHGLRAFLTSSPAGVSRGSQRVLETEVRLG